MRNKVHLLVCALLGLVSAPRNASVIYTEVQEVVVQVSMGGQVCAGAAGRVSTLR